MRRGAAMAEQRPVNPLWFAALFMTIAALSLFIRKLPLGTRIWEIPGPDLLACIALAWVVRRPDYLPAPVIAATVFLEDLLLMRPPGLWALLVLLGSEFLRRRAALLRGLNFGFEYMLVAAVILALFLANRVILAIVMVAQPSFGLSFAQSLGTVLAYPAVVALSHFVLRVRKPATGEVNALGQKL